MTDHLSEAESALKRAQAAIDDYRGHTWPSAVIVVYGGIIDALDAIAAHREQQKAAERSKQLVEGQQ